MKKISTKRVCVYCGSNSGIDYLYPEVAARLGKTIVKAGFELVYGGGKAGLMGKVAIAVKENYGYVIGIMPSSLVNVEMAFREIDEYYEVSSFHERKMMMFKLSDIFVALPGGLGTLEELIEQISWYEMGYHSKPIISINTNGYWNYFLEMLDKIKILQVNRGKKRPTYIVVDQPEDFIRIFLK